MRLKPAFISLSLAAAMAAALMFAVTGCEDDHDLRGDEMYISPSSYTFRRSSDVVATFSVHGAKLPVQWSVADPVLGNVTGVEADKDVTDYGQLPARAGTIRRKHRDRARCTGLAGFGQGKCQGRP